MKKKQLRILLGIGLALILIIFVVIIIRGNKTDSARFKREYEKHNGQKSENGEILQKLSIPKKSKIKYATIEEAIDILKEKTALIYFGMPDCEACRNVVPILLEKVKESDLEELIYVDMTDRRDLYIVKDGAPKEEKAASSEYLKLLDELESELDEYVIEDENGIEYPTGRKRIYAPLIVAVYEGMIVDSHTGSVELEDGKKEIDGLSDLQKSELEALFDRMIERITG